MRLFQFETFTFLISALSLSGCTGSYSTNKIAIGSPLQSSLPSPSQSPTSPLSLPPPAPSPSPSTVPSASSLSVVHSFGGDTGPSLAFCASPSHCDRPEAGVAANGRQLVQISTNHLNVYDYSGNLIKSTPLSTFITNSGVVSTSAIPPYEPHVIYDEFVNRWIVSVSCAYDCLIVSASSDATGAWSGTYIDNDNNDPSIHMGYDQNGVYIEETQSGTNAAVSQGGYAGTFFAIPSSEISWSGTFNPQHKNRMPNMPMDSMPTIDQSSNKSANAPEYFVAKSCGSNCQNDTNFLFQWVVTPVTWSGTTAQAGTSMLVSTLVGSSSNQWLYSKPVTNISQPGTSVQMRETESHRVQNAVQNGSHLYAVLPSGPCTSGCGSQGVDSNNIVIWTDLDCSNPSACTVSQTGKLSDPNYGISFPSIGVASSGNVSVVASVVSPTIPISIMAWNHTVSDQPGSMRSPVTLVSGSQPYTCYMDPESMFGAVGVYTVRDPLDPSKLWITHQFGGSSSACNWNTQILEVAP